MARARNIKPGFFKNELLGEISPASRIFFVGLWCLADREGRFEDRPRRLWGEVMPYDPYEGDAAMDQLEARGFVIRYEVDGVRYGQIVNFLKHQAPHHKERPSVIPAQPITSSVEAKDKTGASPWQVLGVNGASPGQVPVQAPSGFLDSLIQCSSYEEPVHTTVLATPKRPPVPVKEILDLYHQLLPMCPSVQKLTEARRRQIEARWRSGDIPDLDSWHEYFAFVAKSKFLTGMAPSSNGRKPFVADIDFLTRESSAVKIYEGKYS